MLTQSESLRGDDVGLISQVTLNSRRALPLKAKINLSKLRIKEYYEKYNGQVYIAFSGGKDSTVLLDIVRSIYPEVPAVFVDTGLEYPEIREFVKSIDNVIWLKPKYTFKQIIDKYGYPVVSKVQAGYIYDYRHSKSQNTKDKRWNGAYGKKKYKIAEKWKFLINAPFEISDKCCHYLKKKPSQDYAKKTGNKVFLGNMGFDSNNRMLEYQKNGCNMYGKNNPQSWPLGFWSDKDVWEYIKSKNIPYSKIYDMGHSKTGCMFCMFGAHRNKPNRFEVMKKTHPKQYDFCINKLGLKKVCDYVGINY